MLADLANAMPAPSGGIRTARSPKREIARPKTETDFHFRVTAIFARGDDSFRTIEIG
jgi:hypothetical protein